MEKIAFKDFVNTEEYKEFIKKNPTTGKLKIQISTAHQAIPISGVKISIYCKFNDKIVEFFNGVTDESGIIDNIVLPSPNGSYKEVAMEAPKSINYEIVAEHDQYELVRDYTVNIYGGVKTLQYINMHPIVEFYNNTGSVNEQQQ